MASRRRHLHTRTTNPWCHAKDRPFPNDVDGDYLHSHAPFSILKRVAPLDPRLLCVGMMHSSHFLTQWSKFYHNGGFAKYLLLAMCHTCINHIVFLSLSLSLSLSLCVFFAFLRFWEKQRSSTVCCLVCWKFFIMRDDHMFTMGRLYFC